MGAVDIVLGGLGFVGGFYFLTYTYRMGSELSPALGAGYVLMGTIGMLFGGMLCLLAMFGV